MSGATPVQLFFRVRVPSASRQIMPGINQTTMATFLMVIIASSWRIIRYRMRDPVGHAKGRFGESPVAGLVIALMAILMDRITSGFANKTPSDVDPGTLPFVQRHRIAFFGITKLPWPAVCLLLTLLAWQLSGPRVALWVLAGLAFILVSGIWPQAMLSLYLCGIGVNLSFALGTSLGILAAEFGGVSKILRPINDTLQRMPLFVLLIPFVMIFKIGEFTALLAIIADATVPAIRYSEHGLRNIQPEVIEAADCVGCTRWQMLGRVKIPLALPEMMLGLNQTIMYGISMLVIAAVVGTGGLGQQV